MGPSATPSPAALFRQTIMRHIESPNRYISSRTYREIAEIEQGRRKEVEKRQAGRGALSEPPC